MKVISYNVNGIRSAISKGFIEWLDNSGADVICIQETKAQPEQIPIEEFEAIGYKCFFHSAQKKGYSGVGIITKIQPDNIQIGTGMQIYDNEGRFIRADFNDFSIISVYHPSGSSGDLRQDFKMTWLSDFQNYINDLRKTRTKLLISGDYNICHEAIDIHDPVGNAKSSGFLPEERQWFTNFLNDGFIDSYRLLNPTLQEYSWWSFRTRARDRNLGWRIDYHIVTDNLSQNISDAKILTQVVHSDHCPIEIDLNI